MENITNKSASCGPTSIAGKQISSRNAVKHGGCAVSTLILQSESLEDFQDLEARWFNGYGVDPNQSENIFEIELIRTAARSEWFLLRSERNYADIEAQQLNATPDLLLWDEVYHQRLQRFLRYKTANTNILAKNRKAIEDYRKARAAERDNVLKSVFAETRLAITRERLEIYKEKNKPQPTWDESIEEMKKMAAAVREAASQPASNSR